MQGYSQGAGREKYVLADALRVASMNGAVIGLKGGFLRRDKGLYEMKFSQEYPQSLVFLLFSTN